MKNVSKLWKKTVAENALVREMKATGVEFGFYFPASFAQVAAFKNGDTKAVARVFFNKDNVAKIVYPDQTEKEVSWLGAYNIMVTASYGSKVVPVPLPIIETLPSAQELVKRISDWADIFNSIPLVKAHVSDDNSMERGQIIQLSVASFVNILSAEKVKTGPNKFFSFTGYLTLTGNVHWDDVDDENSLFAKKYALRDYKNWQDVATDLIAYVQELIETIPVVPEQRPDISGIISPKDAAQRIADFKDAFAELPHVTVDNDGDDSVGKVFSVDFPVSPAGLAGNLPNGRSGWISFYGNGKARISGDESYEGENCFDTKPFEEHLNGVWDEYISWDDAFKVLTAFLTALSTTLPTATSAAN